MALIYIVEDDDNIVTSIVLNKLKISQVPGLSPEKLAHADEEESGRITYSGKCLQTLAMQFSLEIVMIQNLKNYIIGITNLATTYSQ